MRWQTRSPSFYILQFTRPFRRPALPLFIYLFITLVFSDPVYLRQFGSLCVSTPVSKDTTLTLSNLPYDFCDQCTAAGGHSTHHQGVANEEPGGVVLKTYLPF